MFFFPCFVMFCIVVHNNTSLSQRNHILYKLLAGIAIVKLLLIYICINRTDVGGIEQRYICMALYTYVQSKSCTIYTCT